MGVVMVALISPPVPVSAPASAAAARSALARAEALHDAGLVQRFNAGDQTAFVEIVTRYRAKLLHVALGLLRNHADAEEIAQDTFIRAHRSLALFRGESSLAAWLHCITLNLARNRYWYFFRRRRHVTQSLDNTVNAESSTTYADMIASPAPGPVREASSREFSAEVNACMARLNPRQREILLLRNVRQLSYREISRMLGISIGTVKSRVARARENLRGLLIPVYAETARPGVAPVLSWFESSRPTGLLLRAGS
jgi:RNA polymerase sigma-70 factor (ECF subfamily)